MPILSPNPCPTIPIMKEATKIMKTRMKMTRKAFLVRVIRVLPPLSFYIIIRKSLRVNRFITLSTSAMKNNNRKPLCISCGAVARRI
jgi:hypothetical protein